MKEEKVLFLDFSEKYESPEWSLVYDDSFSCSVWFCIDDYKIYTPYDIKHKFFKKNTKLTEARLEESGFVKIESKTFDWMYNWFFSFLGIESLKIFFSNYSQKDKRYKFDEFIEMSYIEDEFYLVEDWLRYLLAIRWCEENGINYKVKLYDGFPDTAQIKKIRKEILKKIANTTYIEPFKALNEIICSHLKNPK